MITQNFDLNLIPESAPVVVNVNQYDDGTGRLIASLYSGSAEYTPAAGAIARIEGTKPDEHGFSYSATISGNTVTANLTTQMTAVAGRTRAQIVVEESTGKTGTFVFWLDVQQAALNDSTDVSDTEIPAIIDAARANALIASDAAETATTAAENVEGYAEDAEAYAIGTRDGDPVSSSDPAYHNNSKYYAELASDDAAAAATSAQAAAASVASGTQVSFQITGTDLYVTQTIGGVQQPAQNLGRVVANLGTKLTGTVSGSTLSFTDSVITDTCVIDGPYIENNLLGILSIEQTGTTITFTFSSSSADGQDAYIWVRTV